MKVNDLTPFHEELNDIRKRAGLPIKETKVVQTSLGKLYSNPSSQQLATLLKKSVANYHSGHINDEAFVKGFVDRKNNVFWVWDAYEATHHQMYQFLAKNYDVHFGYDRNEMPTGDLSPIIIGLNPYDNNIAFNAVDRDDWKHPAVKAAIRGFPLSKDRLGNYDMDMDALQ